jgi:hypothetical protein
MREGLAFGVQRGDADHQSGTAATHRVVGARPSAKHGLCRVERGLDRRILRKMMKSEKIYTTFLPVVQIV